MSNVTKICRPAGGSGSSAELLKLVLLHVGEQREQLCRALGVAQLIAQVTRQLDTVETEPVAESADLLARVISDITDQLYETDLLNRAREAMKDHAEGGAA